MNVCIDLTYPFFFIRISNNGIDMFEHMIVRRPHIDSGVIGCVILIIDVEVIVCKQLFLSSFYLFVLLQLGRIFFLTNNKNKITD